VWVSAAIDGCVNLADLLVPRAASIINRYLINSAAAAVACVRAQRSSIEKEPGRAGRASWGSPGRRPPEAEPSRSSRGRAGSGRDAGRGPLGVTRANCDGITTTFGGRALSSVVR